MRRIFLLLALLAFTVFLVSLGHGTAEPGNAGQAEESHTTIHGFLFQIVIVLLAAKIGGDLFETLKQPAVLGELVFGMILGNLQLAGITALESFKTDPGLVLFGEIGVILLLFEVGLESNLPGLLAVGASATIVATLGVIAPTALGYGVSAWFQPQAAWYVHLFAGATLAATSVGITARVLKDLRQMHTREARIILGAAVVDDVLGLIMLAVISGLISSVGAGSSGEISFGPVLLIIAKSVAFLAVAVWADGYLGRLVLDAGAKAKVGGMAVVLTVCHCFSLAALAELLGLAPIVGAFAAGLVLTERDYESYTHMRHEKFQEIVAPISAVLVPVFFVLMGLRVDLHSFANVRVLELATGLSVAAIVGKQICALGAIEKGLNRIAIGVGMIPRGEVGLIFAKYGATLMVAGVPIFSPDVFSAMVAMVMVTTLSTPPLLKLLFTKGSSDE